MAASKDLRKQTSTPSTIDPGVVKIYANSNGQVLSITSGNAAAQLGTTFTGRVPETSIQTGMAAYTLTGIYFGAAQGALLATGLANPSVWLPVTFNNTNYAIPAYRVV